MRHAVPHAAAATLLLCLTAPARAQQSPPDLTGMWSDPPATIEDTFCIFYCTDAGLERLEQLLDDEANDERPIAYGSSSTLSCFVTTKSAGETLSASAIELAT
jgi:hypothetical protein